MVISIFLTILTVTITVIPFTGQISFLKERKDEFARGRLIIIAATLLIILSWFQTVMENSKQQSRDETLNSTAENTVELLNQVESSAKKIEETVHRFDSLNTKLNLLNEKTNLAIDKRSEIVGHFDTLNEQLERVYSLQQQKINLGIPHVQYQNFPQWETDANSNSYLEFNFINIGERVAKNFDCGLFLIEADTITGNILNNEILLNNTHLTDIPPTKEGSYRAVKIFTPKKRSDYQTCVLLLYFTYADEVTKEEFRKILKFFWKANTRNDLVWIGLSRNSEQRIDNYIRTTGQKLTTGSGRVLFLRDFK